MVTYSGFSLVSSNYFQKTSTSRFYPLRSLQVGFEEVREDLIWEIKSCLPKFQLRSKHNYRRNRHRAK